MKRVALESPTSRTRSTAGGSTAPAALTGLPDRHGRVATDLRVSLTDHCNLRCTYCMPAEGLEWLPSETLLSDAEVGRLLTIAVTRLGVTDIRFTGGEPLLRKGLADIVAHASTLRSPDGRRPGLSLTTNGLGLDRRLPALVAAGLDRVNVSVDSLDPQRFAAITRRDRLADVLRSLDAVAAAGLRPVKVNAVPVARWYRDDAPALLRYCLERGFELRFIEQMPIGPPDEWDHTTVVTAQMLRDALTDGGFTLADGAQPRGSAPAELTAVSASGLPDGRVGLIASVTEPFCGSCTRTRLTADGSIRSCLFAARETDLRGLLRSGADDEAVARRWQEAMWGKPRAHGFDHEGFAAPGRTMSRIGG